MHGIRRNLAALGLCAALATGAGGCATLSLPDDATPSEKRAALCLDAAVGLATAEAALSGHLDDEAALYWTSFASGCRIAIAAYCRTME